MTAVSPLPARNPVIITTPGGWPVAVTRAGKLRPVVRGGEGPEATPPAGGTPPAPATPPAPGALPPAAGTPDLTSLQAALDAAKTTAGAEALKPFMDLIGAKTPAELQTFVTAAKTARDASLSDEQRRQEALDTREAELTAREAASAAIARAARVQLALVAAGAPGATAARLVALVALPDGDVSDDVLAAAVEATKVEFAPLFAPPTAGTLPPAPSGRAPGAKPPAPAGTVDPLAAGAARAAQVKANRAGGTKEDLFAAFSPRPSPLVPSSN